MGEMRTQRGLRQILTIFLLSAVMTIGTSIAAMAAAS